MAGSCFEARFIDHRGTENRENEPAPWFDHSQVRRTLPFMRIDIDEARRIAMLARLELSPAQLERMAGEMTKILGYIDQLRRVEGSEDRLEPAPLPLRADEPHETLGRELVARNAPEWENGFFIVPRVIGE